MLSTARQPVQIVDAPPGRFNRGLALVGLLMVAVPMPGFGAVVGSAGAADVMAVRSGTASGATTLENALTFSRTRDQDNLDLLLEMSGSQPGTPDGSALATASALLGTDAGLPLPLPLPQTVRQRSLRDWEQAAGDIGGGSRGDPRGPSVDRGGAPMPLADLRVLQEPLVRTAQLVRDNRAWLLGGLVLLVLLGVAVKVFSRRI